MLAVPVVTNPGSNTVRVSSTTKASLAAIDGMRMYSVHLVRIEAERIAAVDERVGVDRLLERLAQQVLARLGTGDVLVDGEDDVVRR